MPDASSLAGRRRFLACAAALTCQSGGAEAAPAAYARFLDGVRRDALASGISAATLQVALALGQPNPRVVELDRHQPEFTLTWAQYRARVLPPSRLERGRQAHAAQAALFDAVMRRYRVDPGVIIGIWGLESDFGGKPGKFGVIDALATLAFDGRRARFFRTELINALRIADRRAVPVDAMLGSYAGAMGQPQFMPSAYLAYARSFSGGDRADIWTSEPDVFASIANYLARAGWRLGEPSSQPVRLLSPIDPGATGRGRPRTLGQGQAAGVRRIDGAMFSRPDVSGSLLLPDGAGGEAFLVYANFDAIRRYNPSDFYALAVGVLDAASS